MSYISSKVVATTSFILSSNIIQNGDILVLAYPNCPGKWPFNDRCRCIAISVISKANVSPIPCIRL